MVSHALDQLPLAPSGRLFIENVGNQVCPAAIDLGEAHKVVVLSVAEGEDKPLKYPDMFTQADLMLLSKVDLLPHLDFDISRCLEFALRVNPQIQILNVSARTGEGLRAFYAWIEWRSCLARQRGGVCEAAVRALLYVGLGLPQSAVDERAFAVLRQIRAEHPESGRLSLVQFKELVKEQYLMLRSDQERAVAALPKLLPADAAERDAALALIRRVASAAGEPMGEAKTRLARIEALFAAATAADGEQWEVAPPTRGRPHGEARQKNGGAQRSA